MGKSAYTTWGRSKRTYAYDGGRGNQSFTILERTYKLSDLNESCVSWLLSDWLIASVLRELSPENRIYSIFSGHRKQD